MAVHLELKTVLTLLGFAVAIATSFAITQSTAQSANTKADANAAEIQGVKGELVTVAGEVADNGDRLKEQAAGINWIGSAVEKLADAEDVDLPRRPVVSED